MTGSKLNAFSFEIFRTNLFLATHSETDCSSLLRVAVISVAVVADVYSVDSYACIDTLAWHVVSKDLKK